MNFLLLVYFFFYVVYAIESSDDCTFIDGSDVQKSKQTLKRLDPLRSLTFKKNVTVDGKEITFKFSLCRNPNPGHCRANSSVVMETGGNATTIGLYNETEITGGDNWITVTLSGGDAISDPRCSSVQAQSVINVVCDPTRKQDEFDVIHFPSSDDKHHHPAHCFYSFLLSQTAVCEAKHGEQIKEGVSGGTVICILFFTITGVYFVFGFLYRRIVVRAKGLEQIPNYDFWREFGNLQADGCDFVCRCGGRQEAKMYQGIDDPLGGHDRSEVEDRDDRLLPM